MDKQTILAIESSCDETSVAVVRDGKEILSHVLASSQDLHRKTGGIVPEVAAREQMKLMLPVLQESLEESFGQRSFPKEEIDALAVTASPGLIGSLIVGVETAKTLSVVFDKPLIPVNHLLAHLYLPFLEDNPPLPAVCLLVSGGHTEIFLFKNHGGEKGAETGFSYMGGTRDDASGEAFDKASKILGLGYPGGPAIQKASEQGDPSKFSFPRPLHASGQVEFSFSGLKTSLYYLLKENPHFLENEQTKADLAASFQKAVIDILLEKTQLAIEMSQACSVILGGGVSANQLLRKEFTENLFVPVYFPPVSLSGDNAVGTAICAYYNFCPQDPAEVFADPNFDSDIFSLFENINE